MLRTGSVDRAGGRVLKARLYLLSTVSALALSGAASAADLPVKAPRPAPVIATPVISWAGPYIGAHGGIGWMRASQTGVRRHI
jgi:outer membrane immunogenic protein